jgi:hypothetical protein
MAANRKRVMRIGAAVGLVLGIVAPAFAHDMASMNAGGMMDMDHMGPGHMEAMSAEHKGMEAHMAWTTLRPSNDADKQKAAEIVETLKSTLGKYKDYRTAEKDGFEPFHPELKQPEVHFTRKWYAIKAAFVFDPAEPTSLLYRRTPDGGYELVGAMYTAGRHATEDKLNERVPLSVARWHRHINLCFPPRGTDLTKVDWTKFGPMGSIATRADCDAAHGRFAPQIFGWMVHVYPWETDPSKVWAH